MISGSFKSMQCKPTIALGEKLLFPTILQRNNHLQPQLTRLPKANRSQWQSWEIKPYLFLLCSLASINRVFFPTTHHLLSICDFHCSVMQHLYLVSSLPCLSKVIEEDMAYLFNLAKQGLRRCMIALYKCIGDGIYTGDQEKLLKLKDSGSPRIKCYTLVMNKFKLVLEFWIITAVRSWDSFSIGGAEAKTYLLLRYSMVNIWRSYNGASMMEGG